jgi:hypothetical protein
VPPGRQGEAPIREPGDLPSVRVDATNIGRGVPMDDPKGESPLVLARAGGMRQVTRGLFVLTLLKNAVHGGGLDQLIERARG